MNKISTSECGLQNGKMGFLKRVKRSGGSEKKFLFVIIRASMAGAMKSRQNSTSNMQPPVGGVAVLQVLPALGDGGVEESAVEMGIYLKNNGLKPFVASAGGAKVARLDAAGVAHVTLPLQRKNPVALAMNAVKLLIFIKQNNIKLVHARSRAPGWSAWAAARLAGVPFITTFHGTHKFNNPLKKLYNSSMARGDVVIANSRFIARHVVESYGLPAHKLVLAQRGVDAAKFGLKAETAGHKSGPQAAKSGKKGAEADENAFLSAKQAARASLRTQHGVLVEENTPCIVMIGRLTRWKGQHVLIDALATLSHTHPALRWQAVLVGSGGRKGAAYEQQLRAQVHAANLASRVHFAGSRSDVVAFYKAAHVAVSASIEPEAFGRVAIEAMASGTPVVASAHGGSLETVIDGQTGLLVPAGNAPALAAAIASTLQNPTAAARMAAAGRAHVAQHFTSQQTCAAEWQAYAHILLGQPLAKASL